MKIVIDKPPNFESISHVFPLVLTEKGILYCWDDTIYNPDGVLVSKPLIAHEKVHSIRQTGKPDVWWEHYLETKLFRFEEELAAYRSEYRVACLEEKDRNQRNFYLVSCARRLAGPLYGNCVTFPQALNLIKEA
jgi:hypothetical protein